MAPAPTIQVRHAQAGVVHRGMGVAIAVLVQFVLQVLVRQVLATLPVLFLGTALERASVSLHVMVVVNVTRIIIVALVLCRQQFIRLFAVTIMEHMRLRVVVLMDLVNTTIFSVLTDVCIQQPLLL